jgi:hypothetical protein
MFPWLFLNRFGFCWVFGFDDHGVHQRPSAAAGAKRTERSSMGCKKEVTFRLEQARVKALRPADAPLMTM